MFEIVQEFLQDDHDQEEGDGAPEPDREEHLGEDVPASVLEEEAPEEEVSDEDLLEGDDQPQGRGHYC